MSDERPITYKPGAKTIGDLVHLFEADELNLDPGFQRQSVWTDRDRKKLIDSIIRGYPLPAIFLYRRPEDDGELVFDVIDGKQRLETILMFMREMRGAFQVRTQLPGSDSDETVDWRMLKRRKRQNLITGYEIPVVEVNGELGDIINVFVLINSTGKALTQQEKRHARYSNTPLLTEAAKLANKFEAYLRANVLSAGQISRMKHVELICELMLSLLSRDVLNKKAALDRIMAASTIDGRQLPKAKRMVTTTMNRVRRMFPQLRTSRFRQITDFYTLAVLIGKYDEEGLILTNPRRNRLAWEMLKTFGARVDEIRVRQRRAQGAAIGQELYRDYLISVSQMTDAASSRRKRQEILDGILKSVFATKDMQRGFSQEQRRILWSTSAQRKCTHKNCNKTLTWDDFTIDHIDPYSKGGRSRLANAALMCRTHNSSKGNRRHV